MMKTMTATIQAVAVLDGRSPLDPPDVVDGYNVTRGQLVLVWNTDINGLWQICDGYWRRLAPFADPILVEIVEGVIHAAEKFVVDDRFVGRLAIERTG